MVQVEFTGPEVEVAYYIVRDHWGQGYATEAARACFEHGFADLGMDRIIGVAWPDNPASLRVMEKSGMTYEGIAHLLRARDGPVRRRVAIGGARRRSVALSRRRCGPWATSAGSTVSRGDDSRCGAHGTALRTLQYESTPRRL